MNTTERFWAKVEVVPGTNCLRWTGCEMFFVGGTKTAQPHRFAWEVVHGPAPKGRRLKRVCPTPQCVNGNHWKLLLPPERFMSYVEKTDGCWLWQGDANKPPSLPYGRFQEAGRSYLAHRFSYELANGPIPDGMHVCHHCDNPPCVRPDHLFLGTDSTNAADMVAKGRSLRGEASNKAKLTEEDVRTIRRSRADALTLAAQFGVTRAAIYAVRRRVSWRHI